MVFFPALNSWGNGEDFLEFLNFGKGLFGKREGKIPFRGKFDGESDGRIVRARKEPQQAGNKVWVQKRCKTENWGL